LSILHYIPLVSIPRETCIAHQTPILNPGTLDNQNLSFPQVSLRSDFNRLSEHRQQEGRGSYPDTRSSYDTNIGDSFATAQLGHYTMGQGTDKARVVSIPSSDVSGLPSRSGGAVSSELMLA
jgi:hypothetical protein